jgi:hypothetical protein
VAEIVDYISVTVTVQSMDGKAEGQGWLPFKDPCNRKDCALRRAWVAVGKQLAGRYSCGQDLIVELHFVHNKANGVMAQQLAEQHKTGFSLDNNVMGWTEIDRITFRPTEGGENGQAKG